MNIYVDYRIGRDRRTGHNPLKPKKTINAAVKQAKAGDSIIITYESFSMKFIKSEEKK